MKYDEHQPLLLLMMSFPINSKHSMTVKAAKLLEENKFLKRNLHEFAKLIIKETKASKHTVIGKMA